MEISEFASWIAREIYYVELNLGIVLSINCYVIYRAPWQRRSTWNFWKNWRQRTTGTTWSARTTRHSRNHCEYYLLVFLAMSSQNISLNVYMLFEFNMENTLSMNSIILFMESIKFISELNHLKFLFSNILITFKF